MSEPAAEDLFRPEPEEKPGWRWGRRGRTQAALAAAPAAPPNPPPDVPPGGRLPRRQFFNEMPDKGFFVIVAIAGFASILALKHYEFPSNYVAGFAVALMVIYGAVSYRMPLMQLRLDRLGDNFYYLGFIYTLASLSAALFQLQEEATRIDALLGNFGIALATTIVGIAGRVMFVQMRGELDQIEERTRRDLLETSERLRAQLTLTMRDLELAHTSILQTATETLEAAIALARTQIEGIAEVAATASGHIDRVFETHVAHAKEASAAITETSKSVEALARKVSAMELPGERLDAQLVRIGELWSK